MREVHDRPGRPKYGVKNKLSKTEQLKLARSRLALKRNQNASNAELYYNEVRRRRRHWQNFVFGMLYLLLIAGFFLAAYAVGLYYYSGFR